jgi:hypothetical protein
MVNPDALFAMGCRTMDLYDRLMTAGLPAYPPFQLQAALYQAAHRHRLCIKQCCCQQERPSQPAYKVAVIFSLLSKKSTVT